MVLVIWYVCGSTGCVAGPERVTQDTTVGASSVSPGGLQVVRDELACRSDIFLVPDVPINKGSLIHCLLYDLQSEN